MKYELGWESLVALCTDGAPAMTGSTSGFKALVKNVAPHVTFTHCMHRYALAIKTLPTGLQEVLTDVVKIVNHIRGSATATRIFKALCEKWLQTTMFSSFTRRHGGSHVERFEIECYSFVRK